MKLKETVVKILVTLLCLTPAVVFAEEGSGTGAEASNASAVTIEEGGAAKTGKPIPPPTKRPQAEVMTDMRGKGGFGGLGTTTVRHLNGLPPGAPQGGRMTASETMTLPLKLEKGMDDRDGMREKMMRNGSSTEGMRERMMRSGSSTDDKRGEMGEKMKGHRGEILKNIADTMIKRMQAAIARLEKLADRIDSRIAKLKEGGTDTSDAESKITIARAKISDASAAVTNAEAVLGSAIANADQTASSSQPTDAGKPVREALGKAKDALMSAHKALIDAITSLSAAGGGLGGEKNDKEHMGSGTPKMPGGMMRTKDHPMPTSTNGTPDGSL